MDWTAQLSPSMLLQYVATPPVASNSAGVKNQFSYDNDFLYICIATNTWRRVGIAAW